jgi:RHS repeat-associated protein
MYRPALYKKGIQIVRQETISLESENFEYSPGQNVTVYRIVTSDDGRHALAPVYGSPGMLRSVDASGFLRSGSINIDRNGVRGGTQDPNGNSTDTLGRTPVTITSTTNYTGCTGPRPIVSASNWNMLVQGGAQVAVKVCSVTVHLKTNFGVTDHEFEADRQFVQSIVLPNGTAWTFEYADVAGGFNYGDLTKLTFPTGGSLSYTWISFDYSRWVATRTVDANDGTGPRTWTYSWAVPNVGIAVTDPVGNDSVHSMAAFGGEDCKYEVQAKSYEGSHTSGTLLKTITTDYSWSFAPVALGPCATNVVAIRTTTIWPNGLQTKVERDYDSGFTWSSPAPGGGGPYTGTFGNVVQQREYAYGTGAPGALVRKTETAYLALTDANYRNNNLIDLVSSVTVRDGAGAQVALTTYAYDTQPLQASGVTVGFTTSPPNGTYRGNLTSVSRWLNTTGGYIASTVKYYDTGMVYQQSDPLSHLTTTEYSLTFHGAYPTRVTNHLGHQVNMAYDFSTGLLTSSTDPNNRTTSYTYDSLSRPDIITAPDSGSVNFDYTDSAPFKVTITAQIDATKNLVTEGEVDGLGRLRFTRLTSDPQGAVFTRTDYDALGRKQFEWNPTRCNITVGTPPGSCSGESTYGKTETQYDPLGRVTKLIPPDGTSASNNVTSSYSANSTTVTDQAGKQRRSFTDALGRLIQVDEPFPTLATPAVTQYTYDTLDNLTCVAQKGSDGTPFTSCGAAPATWRPRSFTYDSLSRLLTANNPESGLINYTYDNDSNLATKMDARSIVTTYGYDGLHRLTSKTYSDTTPAATFTYDVASVDGLSILNPVGRLVKAATANTRTVNSYDEMGRVKDQWQCTPSNCGSGWFGATYTYTKLGGVASQSNPMGFTLTQGFNAAARLISIASSWSDGTHPPALFTADAAQGYHPHGALKLAMLGNGLAESAAYNNRLQPTEMRTYDPGPGTDKLKLTYGFVDANGKNNGNVMSSVATGAQSFTKAFNYDELNRLDTMMWSQCNYDWHYDIWGNRLFQDATGGTGPCGEHFPTLNTKNQIADPGFQYDLAGNMNAEPGKTYQYDAENRLISINGGGGNNPEYLYDANARRVRKKIGSTLTEFIYDAAGIVAERESTNGGSSWTWTKGYVYLGSEMLVQYNGVIGTQGATAYFAHKDHLGSTRLLTKWDKSYDPADAYDYLPFGESASTGSTTHKFTGKERDSESGLDYFGARYYASALGRFQIPDEPFADQHTGNPQSWNLYSYVRNDPLGFTDPTGQGAASIAVRNARKVFQKGLFENARRKAVRDAWKHEKASVLKGEGTRRWTKAEIKELLATGRVKGYEGHHINSVKGNDLRMAMDPSNIQWVKGRPGSTEHLELHGGNFQNPTSGPLVDRIAKLGGAGLLAFFVAYDQKVNELISQEPLASDPDSLASYVNPVNYFIEQIALTYAFAAAAQADEEEKKQEEEARTPSNVIPDQLRGSSDGAHGGVPKRR